LEAFYTVQHFPPYVTSILYRYLVFIHPFARWSEEVSGLDAPDQPCYLWPARHKHNIEPEATDSKDQEEDNPEDEDPEDEDLEEEDRLEISTAQNQGFWLTVSLTKEFLELCAEFGLSMKLNTQKQRHIAIGFAQKHITAPGKKMSGF
jgi:hypothetical protein